MRFTLCLSLCCIFLLSCGRIPEPVGYDYSVQHKMQAAYHWEVLAADVAYQINNELIRSDFINAPVFVKETCGDDSLICQPNETSSFNETFRDLLITQLVSLGVPTSASPDKDAITVNYKTKLLYHTPGRIRTIRPGAITTLTAGILVLRNAPSSLLTLGLAGALDFANASADTASNYEVIITTSLVDKDKYLFRQSNIYYINDSDFWHYMNDQTETGEIALTNSYFPQGDSYQPGPAPSKETVITPEIEQEVPQKEMSTEADASKNNATDI